MSSLSRTLSSVAEGFRWGTESNKDGLMAEEVKCYHGTPHTLMP